MSEWLPLEKLTEEHSAVGFYLSGHPLDDYQKALRQSRVTPYSEVLADPAKVSKEVRLAGTVIAKQVRKSQRSGKPFAFVTLTDPTGQYEVTVFSETLAQAEDLLDVGNSIVLVAEAQWEGAAEGDDQLKLLCKSVAALDTVAANAASSLRVYLDSIEPLESIRERLDLLRKSKTRGKGKVVLVLMLNQQGQEVEVELPGNYNVDPKLKGAMKSVFGVVDVDEL